MTDQDTEPTSRFSSRVAPFWLNPATIKGTIAILAGLFLLCFGGAAVQHFLHRFLELGLAVEQELARIEDRASREARSA